VDQVDQQGFKNGIEHFNSGEFFEAHEVWEDVWRAIDSPREKLFVQGLIQVAVALHHHSTGNEAGAESLLRRASRNLAGYPPNFGNIDLRLLLQSLAAWRQALQDGSVVPAKPRVEVVPG
jgi:uncharacterized protein